MLKELKKIVSEPEKWVYESSHGGMDIRMYASHLHCVYTAKLGVYTQCVYEQVIRHLG